MDDFEFDMRAMTESEDKYTFRQEKQDSDDAGLIGYLRADMDTDGNGFFSTWNDWNEELKTTEFKTEFDNLINSLREEGDILYNRKALAKYCYSTPQSRMTTEQDYYGVRADTGKYTYLLRLNPNKGEYNLYCYCYVRELLERHMKKNARGVLPEQCYSLLPGSSSVIIIKNGEKGYYKTDIKAENAEEARALIDEYNRKLGVTRPQEEAMKTGSMFGFHVPGADPRYYDNDGKPIIPA